MPNDDAAAEVERILRAAFDDYSRRRTDWYANPRLLRKLLLRDALPFALRGVSTAREFLHASFAAHEAASEETMLGNAWQAALTLVAPRTVGGGDLRVERDGELWIIQVKMQPRQNAGARAQDLRLLREKVMQESATHQPGRKSGGVKGMMAYLNGPPESTWVNYHHRSANPTNSDLHGWGYQLKVGPAFFAWIGAGHDRARLISSVIDQGSRLRELRERSLARLDEELQSALSAAGLPDTLNAVVELQERPWPRAQRTKIPS